MRVTNAAELKNALSGSTAKDIILANGTYDNSGPFKSATAHRLWAEQLGGATLKVGIHFSKDPGAEVHGIGFDVDTNSKTQKNSIIYADGSAHRVTITDSWFDGHREVMNGIFHQAVHGVKLQRLVLKDFQRTGIIFRDVTGSAGVPAKPPPTITDIDVSYIKHKIDESNAKCCNGTAEFGIQLGNSGPGGIVERINCHHVDWSCILPVHNSHGTLYRDIRIDYTNSAGFYWEHFASDNILERFKIGPHVQGGIAIEPALQSWGDKPSGQNTIIRDGVIESSRSGAGIGACNGNTRVERVKFIGQCFAGIVDNVNWPASTVEKCDPKPAPSVIRNNDYSELDAGTPPVREGVRGFGSDVCGHWDPWQ